MKYCVLLFVRFLFNLKLLGFFFVIDGVGFKSVVRFNCEKLGFLIWIFSCFFLVCLKYLMLI